MVTPPPPQPGFIKVNYDAAISSSHSTLAVIAKDPHRAILKVWARIAPKLSPLQVETMALHWAVQLAIREKWSHVQFKGDSKVCYEVFLANGPCSAWAISYFVSNIRDLALCIVSCNFLWVRRGCNYATHIVAKFSLASNESCFFNSANFMPCLVHVCKEEAPHMFSVFLLINCSLSKKKKVKFEPQTYM